MSLKCTKHVQVSKTKTRAKALLSSTLRLEKKTRPALVSVSCYPSTFPNKDAHIHPILCFFYQNRLLSWENISNLYPEKISPKCFPKRKQSQHVSPRKESVKGFKEYFCYLLVLCWPTDAPPPSRLRNASQDISCDFLSPKSCLGLRCHVYWMLRRAGFEGTWPVRGHNAPCWGALRLMLCCRHLEILSHSEQGALHHFHFALGPTNYAAGPHGLVH